GPARRGGAVVAGGAGRLRGRALLGEPGPGRELIGGGTVKKATETDLVRAWRNNTQGVYDPARKLFRKFTGRKGVGDILGVIPLLTDGRQGVFLGVEAKVGANRLRPEQLEWQADVLLARG